MTILTEAERARAAAPLPVVRHVSPEQRLMMLADAGRRAEAAQRRYSATLIHTDPDARPAPLPGGRVSVSAEAWGAHAALRAEIDALIALAIACDAEGRAV